MNVKMLIKRLVGLSLAGAVLFSCEESTPEEKTNTLVVTPSASLSFAATGNSFQELKVETDAKEWAFTSPDWVEVRKEASSLSVKAKDNNTIKSRVGRIEITAGNAKPVKISIVQDGNENGSVVSGISARLVGEDGTSNIRVSLDKEQATYKAIVKVVLDEPASSNQKVTVSFDPEYLSAYEYENKVECELLPENAVAIPENGVITVASGNNESAPFEITVSASDLTTRVNYLLPIVVSEEPEGLAFSVEGKRCNWLVTKKITKSIKNLVYLEVNNTNPLNLLEYKLEDGTPFFDVAVIFAANIRYDKEHDRVLLSFNPNVQALLDDSDIYLQPLRKEGIEVHLGLLGDHTHAGLENLSEKGIQQFASQVADALEEYNLDGINLDDEYVVPDPANTSDLFIGDSDEPTGLKLCYEIKSLSEAKGRKCNISVFNFKWESREPVEIGGVTCKAGELMDATIENYFVDGYPGKSAPWDDVMTLKQCTGLSIECNKGHLRENLSQWNTNVTAEQATAISSEGYGYIMWYAFHPQAGGGLENNASTVDPAVRNVAQGLYGQSIITPEYYYKKIDEGIYSPDRVRRDF